MPVIRDNYYLRYPRNFADDNGYRCSLQILKIIMITTIIIIAFNIQLFQVSMSRHEFRSTRKQWNPAHTLRSRNISKRKSGQIGTPSPIAVCQPFGSKIAGRNHFILFDGGGTSQRTSRLDQESGDWPRWRPRLAKMASATGRTFTRLQRNDRELFGTGVISSASRGTVSIVRVCLLIIEKPAATQRL